MRTDFDFPLSDGTVMKSYAWGAPALGTAGDSGDIGAGNTIDKADASYKAPDTAAAPPADSHTASPTTAAALPKAVLLIIHGSLEHALRYEPFAEFIASKGFAVYSADLRGHGRTIRSEKELNYFTDGPNGWNLVLDDLQAFSARIRETYPKTPLFVLGHSMGSFLARCLAVRTGKDMAGLILSGTGGAPAALLRGGLALAALSMALGIRKKRNPFLHKLVYGTLNNAIENPQTPSDFISRDPETVRAYLADPLSGETATTEYIFEMIKGFLLAMKRSTYRATPKNLPILMFSGEKDPVAGPKGDAAVLKDAHQAYAQAGIGDLTLKIYPEARHEMLNEINRAEVYADVLEWMEKHIS